MSKNIKMKDLIKDFDLLNYLHDLMGYSSKNEEFFTSHTYAELHEKNYITIFKYLKNTLLIISSFLLVLVMLNKNNFSSISMPIQYLLFLLISIIYGKLFIVTKNDIICLKYQLLTKRAAQYALENYNYEQFVVFLDQYLSEMSTYNYIKARSLK